MMMTNADMGFNGLGTHHNETNASLEQYENIFGPAARDIKVDNQRNKRHQRWHLPDALKGHNQYLTDRVDGLITDATNSPFTRNILPYVYLENPDQKLKWNVYSFDEGMASRVPYEAAARVLPQTKRSFAGYVVRQGLAIAMEHNFMVSEAGKLNFKRQLMQLVGSIQLTNDLDVHVALLTAPSYQKHYDEKYMDSSRSFAQVAREYSDIFGMMQKTTNALDILIEDARTHLRTWGSQPPTFLLCNPSLTVQLTMIPEKTNYVTNGPDGARRLANGPDLPSYRGLNIINTRRFSMETGTKPRDLLRRRVRVCQHYHLPADPSGAHIKKLYEFYDESKDSFFTLTWDDLYRRSFGMTENRVVMWPDGNVNGLFNHIARVGCSIHAIADDGTVRTMPQGMADAVVVAWQETLDSMAALVNNMRTSIAFGNSAAIEAALSLNAGGIQAAIRTWNGGAALAAPEWDTTQAFVFRSKPMFYFGIDLLVLRPNIEHEMNGIIIGRGGDQALGATFWGQTEMSCYDDAQHGIWGMSYKYHERAIVTNERNLVRVYDISFDGYNGGMDENIVDWNSDDSVNRFCEATTNATKPYTGDSMLVIQIGREDRTRSVPNPLVFANQDDYPDRGHLASFDFQQHSVNYDAQFAESMELYFNVLQPRVGLAFNMYRPQGNAGQRAISNETESFLTSYHGYLAVYDVDAGRRYLVSKKNGSGHLGPCYEGVANIRMGRGLQVPKMGPFSAITVAP